MDSVRLNERQTYSKEKDIISRIYSGIAGADSNLSNSCLKKMLIKGYRRDMRFLRRHVFVLSYLCVGYGIHYSAYSWNFNWKHPTDVKKILRTLKPRAISDFLIISDKLIPAGLPLNNFKKFSMDLLEFSAYTLKECQIEGLDLSKKQFKKIVQCCRWIKFIDFQRCAINFDGITLNNTLEYKTEMICFNSIEEQTTGEVGNDSSTRLLSIGSFKNLITSISECGLKNSLKRLSFGQCELKQVQVLTSLEELNLYNLKISFFSIPEDKHRNLLLDHKTSNSDETLTLLNEKKCIIQ
ncbi:unnamed protein product [Moneuplotes crassus]|uniref:Uncharacterized protein n=1 Tax=Euplotes crassus TaxID=5936 RepID=A0AAD1XP91_EUPCR|nr:unnamed protein product [Moneuplotes crassus]